MSSSEFPPNSEASKKSRPEEKNITPVVTGGAVKRKKSLRRKFSETFIGGDFKSSVQYGVLEVLLPSSREMIYEFVSEAFRKLIFGENMRRGGSTRPQSGPTGYVSYNRYSMGPYQSGPQRVMSREARAGHNFDEIVLDDRMKAQEVLDQLFEVVSQFESATVADLYALVGLPSTHTDHKWGWMDLHGSGVTRIPGGYLLDLPKPEPLN